MERLIGVVLLPDRETDLFVRALSRCKPNNRLLLGLRDGSGLLPPHPHISLLQCVIDASMFRDFSETVFELAPATLKEQTTISLHVAAGGWCFLETPRTRPLLALQHAVLDASKGFRHGSVPISWQSNFTPAQARAYKLYGYPNIGYAWSPHFTFGIVRPWNEEENRLRWTWQARSLAIVSLGPHGIATEILAEHPFRTS